MGSIYKGNPEESNLILYVDNPDQLDWDIEVDTLVIGGGGCGLTAALAAAEMGSEVFLLEKEKNAGGNTSLSQAMVPAAGTEMQKASGIKDSPALMTADILNKNKNGSDPELTLHISEQSASLVEWLRNTMNIDFRLVDDFLYPGHSVHRIHTNASCKGEQLVNELLKATERFENISISYNTPATRIIARRSDSSVFGVEANIEGFGKNLARAKSIILALNGFGANREMLKQYIPEMLNAQYFGHEGNTGEGIRWGEALGAELACMGAYQAHGSVAHPHGTLLTWAAVSLGGYQVNLDGRRFVNEYHGYSEHALSVLDQQDNVAVEIFDDRIYQTIGSYEDFQLCVEMGAVKKFDDIKTLANGFNLPENTLSETHHNFQKAARGESADSLGRTEFCKPLHPPYYGVKVTGALFHTQGGLKVDKHARVLHHNGSPHSKPLCRGGDSGRILWS
jgi:fumarate reductase flavoprotein subunit